MVSSGAAQVEHQDLASRKSNWLCSKRAEVGNPRRVETEAQTGTASPLLHSLGGGGEVCI